jgi:uncharacterized protein (TIGR02246 family)
MSEAVSDAERAAILSACERLSLDYSHHADLGQMEAFAGLFAEDAELVVAGAGTKGRAAILKSVTSQPRGEVQSVHAISNLRIDVVGPTEARGEVYITAFMAPKKDGAAVVPEIRPMAVGRYLDVYKKTAEGWRFARREFAPLIMAGA